MSKYIIQALICLLIAPCTVGDELFLNANNRLLEPVSEEELALIRGRFVRGKEILYFGIEMQTQWQTPAGDSHLAGLMLAFDFPSENSGKPNVTIFAQVPEGATSKSPTSPLSAKLPIGAAGAIQSIQVQGHANDIWNNLSIDVLPDSAESHLNTATAGNVALSRAGSHRFELESQSGLNIRLSPSVTGYQLDLPGGSTVTQQFNQNGLFQGVQLKANQYKIKNNLHLLLQFKN